MKITTIYEFDIVWCLSSLGVQHGCGTFDFFCANWWIFRAVSFGIMLFDV